MARPGRSPTSARSSTTHSGTDAMSSAARLEGTSRSATVTRPLPPPARSGPTTAAHASCLPVTRAGPRRTRSTIRSSTPATAKRSPAPSSGGTVRTMSRIARYVEPQMT